VYWMSSRGVEWARAWVPTDPTEWPFAAQLGVALVLGTFSSWAGLWFGHWMAKVRR
jgi:hypothetical protein